VHYPKKKSLVQVLFGGEGGGLSSAANWIIYRYLRDDVAETWRMLSRENLYLMDETVAR